MNNLLVSIIKFGILMIVVAIVAGVIYEETTKSLFTKNIEFGLIRDAKFDLSLLHGMTLAIGVFIPLSLAFITYFLKEKISDKEAVIKNLGRAFLLYQIGAIASLTLFAYKGLAFVYMFQLNPSLDLNIINQSLFLGNKMLRIMIYATSHTILGIGLFWYLYILNAYLAKTSERSIDIK